MAFETDSGKTLKKYVGIYVPMLIGALIGWAVSYWLGLGGVGGMIAGACCWLAWETRKQDQSTREHMSQMERDLLRRY